MALNMSNMQQPSGNTFGFPFVGVHAARFVGVVDLGSQDRQPYKGQAKSPCGQLSLTFELTEDFVEIDGVKKPRWISKKVNAFSGNNASLVDIVNKLDPAGTYKGDLAAMARATLPCLLTIVQKTDQATQAPIEGVRISDIGGVPDGFPINPAQNPPLVFDWDAPDMAVWDRMPGWQQEVIKKAHNFQGSKIQAPVEAYDAQKASQQVQTQAQAQPSEAGQANPAPATQRATVATNQPQEASAADLRPAAPPGYHWDEVSGTFKPGVVSAQVAQQAVSKAKVTIPQGYPPGWCVGPDGVPVAFDPATMEVDAPQATGGPGMVGNQTPPSTERPY